MHLALCELMIPMIETEELTLQELAYFPNQWFEKVLEKIEHCRSDQTERFCFKLIELQVIHHAYS